MSQIWKEMNNTGKYCLIFGAVMIITGLILAIGVSENVSDTDYDDAIVYLAFAAVISPMGWHYMTVACYDDRCNIKYVKPVKVKVNDEHHEIGG